MLRIQIRAISYAVFSRDLLFRLRKDGWDISMVGFFGNEGYYNYQDGGDLIDDRFSGVKLKVYPKMNDPYGSDALVEHATDFGAHVAFAMIDLWTLNPNMLQELVKRNIKFIPYLPIDQDPPPGGVLTNLSFAHKIITFSKYGQGVLHNHGFTSTLIPEGIDTEHFKSLNKEKCRGEYQIPHDAFVFGMIGANKENPPRKGYQEALEAFKMFVDKHPEGRLFVHTQQSAPMGFPILDYSRYLGIADKVLFLAPYKASFKSDFRDVIKQINMFDVLLHPSMTEGFGLLSVEAQSCGVPVIVNRCHAQPELVVERVTGEISETAKPFWRNLNAYIYPADVNSLYEKMEILYAKCKNKKQRQKMARLARENVVKNYNIDTLTNERWIPFLEELQDELLPNLQIKK